MLTEVGVRPTPTSQTLRRLWRIAAPHRPLLFRALLCTAVLGGATGLLAALIGPALRFLLTGGELPARYDVGSGWWRRLLSDHGPQTLLWFFPACVALVGAVKGLAYLGQFYAFGWFGQQVSASLRRALFVKLSGLSPTQRALSLSGDLEARLTQDVAAVELAATYTVGAYLRDGIQLAVLGALAFALDWRLASLALGLLPLAAWPTARLSRLFLQKTRSAQAQGGLLAAQIREGLTGLRTLQAFGAERLESKRFRERSQAQRRLVSRAAWNRGAVPALMEVLAAAAVAGILVGSASFIQVPPEKLISFLAAVVLVYQPTKELGRVGAFALQAAAAGERIFGVLDLPEAVSDDGTASPPDRAAVQFEGVRFTYGDRPALDGLSLRIEPGRLTALVGASGSGKSTVARLLLRFEDPREGAIRWGELDLRDLALSALRARIALVTQEPLLFSATVLENIRVGRLEATMEEVQAAARAVGAEPFILDLPEGYQTHVGERGLRLSGGQRQRLCLARAVLSEAPLWVLDEPTSSLDSESERQVESALSRLLPGRTAVLIAHRLSTVVAADEIHVVEEGRVVESGDHRSLLDRGGAYARLWAAQGLGSAA